MIIANATLTTVFSQCTQLDKSVHVSARAVGKPFRKVLLPRGSRPCLWACCCCCWQGHIKGCLWSFLGFEADLWSVTQVYSHSAVNELIDVPCQSLWPTAAAAATSERGNHRASRVGSKRQQRNKMHIKRASSSISALFHSLTIPPSLSFSLPLTVCLSACLCVCLRHINYSFTLTFYYFLRLPRCQLHIRSSAQ